MKRLAPCQATRGHGQQFRVMLDTNHYSVPAEFASARTRNAYGQIGSFFDLVR
jgi:hypothetical protein